MLSQSTLVAFVPTVDAEHARQFYVDVLKLEFVKDDGFALVLRSNDNSIRIVKLEKHTPLPFTILGWEVADIATAVGELTAAGVAFSHYSFLQQDEVGVWTAPTGEKVAWFQDPDGNVLSVSQH
jgi:catechol 2,3-dioxygenase-like lactoylglutathione lyase family enzyme